MMIRHILPLLIASPAQAAIIGVVPMEDARLLLHDEQRVCVGQARYAEYVARDGGKVGGCWVFGGGMIGIAFFDGDTGRVPVDRVKKPDEV